MAKTLRLGPKVHLPIDGVTQTFGVIGRRGSGKTNAATVLVEQLLEARQQVVVIDVVGTWWGLRLQPDGKSPAVQIPVLGGHHGDVPLNPESGPLIANLIVEKGLSAVIDVSLFRKAEHKRFVTGFAEELLRLKKRDRSPMHLVLEEAQRLAPQRPRDGEQAMLGAIEDIVRLGRNYGIGATLISQRPQSINKEVLSQVECLLVFQLNHNLERKAISDWVVSQGIDVGEMVDHLPSLPRGTAFLWSPQWLDRLERVKISKHATYDAAATPTARQRSIEPRALEPKELSELEGSMSDVVERAKANDPKRLRARIAELEKARGAPDSDALEQVRREVSAEANRAIDRLEEAFDDQILEWSRQIRGLAEELDNVSGAIALGRAARDSAIKGARGAVADAKPAAVQPAPAARARPADRTRVEQRILDALAELQALGIPDPPRVQVGLFVGYKNTQSKGFANALSQLSSRGLISYPPGKRVALTGEGAAAARRPERPRTNGELHERICDLLEPVQWRILEPVIARVEGIVRADLARATGYTNLQSKGFANSLSRLRTLGLIDYEGDRVVPTDILFPGSR